MAVHLTPDELSAWLGMSRQTVITLCMQESVPIYQGRIDRTLFVDSMNAAGHRLPQSDAAEAVAGV